MVQREPGIIHIERAIVRGDAGTLEINFQTGIKRETKKLILYLTH